MGVHRCDRNWRRILWWGCLGPWVSELALLSIGMVHCTFFSTIFQRQWSTATTCAAFIVFAMIFDVGISIGIERSISPRQSIYILLSSVRERFPLRGDLMWLKIAAIVVKRFGCTRNGIHFRGYRRQPHPASRTSYRGARKISAIYIFIHIIYLFM